ncbi:hypothetical protein [Rheinheimera sp. 4Y26]|uniref:hypothetical protein n=1 Tax=Rheinheimera sp. 4Y26 TaxID=2977811 RepID=UPI0021B1325B|nr:hypothetical protein [Rheinheimera sp. 4Y26]MCT6699179.1 hypothetical protein [Rheinheimera sp. 4Y26]
MATIKTALAPYLQKLSPWLEKAQPVFVQLQQVGNAVLSAVRKIKQDKNLQRRLYLHVALLLAGYLLTFTVVYLHSLTLKPAEPLPPALAATIQQQDVTVAELTEAVERLEKKKALAKL